MRLASTIISLCLHTGVFLLIWFWPAPAPIKLDTPPILISLVEGAPGGSMTPSPILGHMGETADGPKAPAPPAPQSEIAMRAREEIIPPEKSVVPPKNQEPPVETPKKPEAIPIPEPKAEAPKEEVKVPETPPQEVKKPELAKEEIKKSETKKPEPKKEEPKKPEPKKPEPKKPEPKKPEPKKNPPKKAVDPVAAALQKARQATSRTASGDKGNAVEQALAQARKNAGGNRGGGGGQGDGPGGGLEAVYISQIMTAVRPNWGFTSGGRRSLSCVVKVTVDMQGNVLEAVVSQGSGNAQYDASAVNAIIRTSKAGDFPPPPNLEYSNLNIVFTIDELMRR